MSLIYRPSALIFRKAYDCIRITKWTNHKLICTPTIRSFHQSSLLYSEGIPLRMPSLSPTMMEGKIVKWLKQEGDTVEPGDVLCDIETDKAVVSFEIDEEGTLAKILVDETAGTINIGTLIAVLAPEGEDWKTIDMPADAGDATPAAAGGEAVAVAGHAGGSRKFGPSVRLLLEQYGLAEGAVAGSGPHGELLKGDVLQHVLQAGLNKLPQTASAAAPPAPLTSPAPPAPAVGGLPPYTDVEVTNMRRTIAKRLLQSKSTIAHSYGTVESRTDALLALRRQYRQEQGVVVSLNDLVIKAVSVALQACPAVNCVWQGDKVVVSPSIDISVAVATPSGLITPIVRNVERLGLQAITETVRDLAARAKENKLKPDEFMGGTFTISNLGMFGISEFTAIINPPQCAILAVGGSRLVPGVDGGPETRMRATLSYDRSAIEDDTAAEFLAALRGALENPQHMLLGGRPRVGDEPHPLAALL